MNIRDIARTAGVSSATVSRVINESGYVKSETREKVLDTIRAANYVPSAIARSLSNKETSSIGVIVPDISNEFFSSLISGIGKLAEANNYRIVFFDSGESAQKEHSFLETVEGQYLAGIIITPVSEQDGYTRDLLLQLDGNGIPVVLADRDLKGVNLDGVFVDNIQGAFDGVEAMIQAGHTKIAIISGPDTSLPGRDRLKGYKKAMAAYKIPPREEYMVSGDFKIDKAYECTKGLLALADPPTGIFTANNQTTLGVLKYFTEQRIKLGADISILGFDQIESLKIIDFRLSTIERDTKQQGMQAMELLLEKLKQKGMARVSRQIYTPYQVVLRGSEKLR